MARSFRRKSPSGAQGSAAHAPGPDAEHAADAPAGERRRNRKATDNGFGAWLKEIATIVVIALVLSFLIKTFLFRAFFIPSGSMEQTLEVDDRIFVNQLVPQPFDLQRGDIVVFEDTEEWLPPQAEIRLNWFREALIFIGLAPDESQQHLVKRVIGLPGDRVVCCDAEGRLTINGKPIEEPYVFPGATPSDIPFDVTVPDGKVWVLGDHRNASADSRVNQDKSGAGFVDIEDIEGKAAVIAWPLGRIGLLDNHSEVFDDVPDAAGALSVPPASR